MTDITYAIDSDATHQQWLRQVEYHLGLVPKLVGAELALATPGIGVSRGGSRFDRPQITGGGYYDSAPAIGLDYAAASDAVYFWSLLAEYATAVSEWLFAPTRIPTKCPDTSRAAHDAAPLIVGTLIDNATAVWAHRALDEFEQTMLGVIRPSSVDTCPSTPASRSTPSTARSADHLDPCGSFGSTAATGHPSPARRGSAASAARSTEKERSRA